MSAWIFVVVTLVATPAGWNVAGPARVRGPFPSEGACETAREALIARVAERPVAVGLCSAKDEQALAIIRARGLFVAENE